MPGKISKKQVAQVVWSLRSQIGNRNSNNKRYSRGWGHHKLPTARLTRSLVVQFRPKIGLASKINQSCGIQRSSRRSLIQPLVVARPLGVVDTRGVVRFRSRDTLFLNRGVQEAANVICDLLDLFSRWLMNLWLRSWMWESEIVRWNA